MDTDKNYDAFPDQPGKDSLRLGPDNWVPPANPLDYDDIVKMSNKRDCVVEGITIPGGKEDCSDAVRGTNYQWRDCRFEPNGDGVLTVKGAIAGWLVQDCTLVRHGRKRDIEVGQFDNYWYPGRKPTSGGRVVRVGAQDGKPVRVLLWDADRPTVEGGNVKVTKMPWVVWFPYFCFMYVVARMSGVKTS